MKTLFCEKEVIHLHIYQRTRRTARKPPDGVGRLALCVVWVVVLFIVKMQAQDIPSMRFGVQGVYGLHQHTANFTQLPGIPSSVPEYSTVSGAGFGGIVMAEIPLISSFPDLFLSLRGGYALHTARLSGEEQALVSVDGSPLSAIFRHTLQASLPLVSLDVMPSFRLPGVLNGFHIMAGIRAGLLLAPTFTQREELIEGTGMATFLGGGTTRNVFTNQPLPSAQVLQLAAIGGIGYDLALTDRKDILLTPEVQYALALTPFVQGLSWQANTLRFGLAVKYNPSTPAPPPQIEAPSPRVSLQAPPPTPAPVPTKKLTANVKAYSVDSDGNDYELILLKTEEFVSRQLYPLLDYIFFDQNSDVIPARYERLTQANTRSFSERRFSGKTALDVYYSILDILGKRLRDNPTATVRLVGCLGEIGFGPTSEENDPTLSQRRAQSVKQYLTDVWGIAAPRISVQGRALPEKPSNSKNPVIGAEENRRVEIYSDSWEIMKPLVLADTLRETDAPLVKFVMNAEASSGFAKWMLRAFQGARKLKEFSTLGAPDANYEWRPSRERSTIPSTEEPLRYELQVLDNDDKEFTAGGRIGVEQITIQRKRQNRIADKEVDVYRLIGFPFEQSAIEGVNARTLKELIKPNIKPESIVTITGHTDQSGDAASNIRLSDARAQAVGREIGIGSQKMRGVGGRAALYTNIAPEGRFYSRTVEIRVETPIR